MEACGADPLVAQHDACNSTEIARVLHGLPGTVLAASCMLVGLRGAGEEGGQQRGADGATEVAREVGEAGDLVGLRAWDADVVEGADGDEDERQSDDLEHAPERDGAEAGVEREPCEVVESECGGRYAEQTMRRGSILPQGAAGDHHHDDHDEAAGREDEAGALRGVAEQDLEVLRDEDGGAEEHHAEDELEEDGGAEVAIARSLRSTMGSGWRHSHQTKTASRKAAETATMRIMGSPNQSFSWPLSRKNSRQPTPEATRARPTKSIGAFAW